MRKSFFSVIKVSVFLWLITIVNTGFAQSFEVLFPYSLGYDALNYQPQFQVGSTLQSMLVDTEIETSGTESKTYDRTLVNFFRLQASQSLNPKVGMRGTILGLGEFRKLESATEPRVIREEVEYTIRPRFEFIFVTQNALEIFVGLTGRYVFPFEVETVSSSLTSKEDYDSAFLSTQHFGFVKRVGRLQGGFYFRKGAEKARRLKKSNDRDGTILENDDVIHDPTKLGIFARVPLGRNSIYVEFSPVQAGEGGNRTDQGATVTEDYISLFSKVNIATGLQGLEFSGSLLYKTLSYADNRDVSPETIPQTGLHFDANYSLGRARFTFGLVLGYGKDGQSIDEFNADYRLIAFGGRIGASASF
ncbi:MAG: hypothetical protein HRU19_10980 [Pseudobacteriovorax sp.]|nr:hypothetical protein [Pseudobacteriovorax sp.]